MAIFGSSGLIEANLKTYFKALTSGLSEDDALAWVIKSRYPMSERNRFLIARELENALENYRQGTMGPERILNMLKNLDKNSEERTRPVGAMQDEKLDTAEGRIKKLVKIIYFNENPMRLSGISAKEGARIAKVDEQVNELYEKIKEKFGFD